MMIFLFVKNEMSYDQFHEKSDRVFRIISHISEKDDSFTWSSTQLPLGRQLKKDYPEVEDFVRIQDVGQWMLQKDEKQFYEEEIYLADSAFFNVFTHKFLLGKPEGCLDEPNSIVLTESLAKKYFGDWKAEEKLELIDEDGDSYKITAIIEDVPSETHFTFDGLVSRVSLGDPERGSWGSFFLYTYILLKPETNWKEFASKLPDVIKTHVDPIFEQYGISVVYEMQPLTEIYLLSKTKGENGGGDMSYIFIFLAVGLFILILASINYMNLATSRAEGRSKEVGVRKVLGSHRSGLIAQFLSESMVISLAAFVLAITLLSGPLLKPFNQLAGKDFIMADLFTPDLLLIYIFLILILGLLSGSYPAFFLSSFKPAWVLKGRLAQKVGGFSVRKVLVVFQFVISIGMVASTWIVNDQLNFLRKKDLGFAKEQLLVVEITDRAMIEKVPVIKEKWIENTSILNVGSAGSSPGRGYSKNLMNVESKDGYVEKGVNLFFVDETFLPTLGIEIIEGRNFEASRGADTAAVIVNEMMVERMGWDDPVGKKIQFGVDEEDEFLTVIGVFRNFHMLSLYEELEDLALFYRKNNDMLHVRFEPSKTPETLSHLEEKWLEVYPERPFNHYFLDQEFYEAYESDQKRSRVFLVFSGLAMLIACLGLLGLVSFSVERRSKEIGIRKIVGASTFQIMRLVAKDYLGL